MLHTNEVLSVKCIYYLFFTTAVNKKAIYDAYAISVQDFFVKPDNYSQPVETVRVIMECWQSCYSPGNSGGGPWHFADQNS